MRRETQLWLERADYDFESAKAMFKSARYLYVAFTCQQAVEKYLKAVIQEKTGKLPPYTHNLSLLLGLAEINFVQDDQEFLVILNQYYLNARYVDFKQRLFNDMTLVKAKQCLQKTTGIIECLRKELKI